MARTYTEIVVSSATYTLATPDVVALFEPGRWRLFPLSAAANDVAYSFDGVNDAGKLFGGAPTNSYIEELDRSKKLWLRKLAGAPTVGVRVGDDGI